MFRVNFLLCFIIASIALATGLRPQKKQLSLQQLESSISTSSFVVVFVCDGVTRTSPAFSFRSSTNPQAYFLVTSRRIFSDVSCDGFTWIYGTSESVAGDTPDEAVDFRHSTMWYGNEDWTFIPWSQGMPSCEGSTMDQTDLYAATTSLSDEGPYDGRNTVNVIFEPVTKGDPNGQGNGIVYPDDADALKFRGGIVTPVGAGCVRGYINEMLDGTAFTSTQYINSICIRPSSWAKPNTP